MRNKNSLSRPIETVFKMAKRNQNQYEAYGEDMYSSSEVSEAKSFMLEEVSQGRMQLISQKHFFTKSRNMWEGEKGLMEHVVLQFPMPALLILKTKGNQNYGEYSKNDVQTNVKLSSSGSSQSKTAIEAEIASDSEASNSSDHFLLSESTQEAMNDSETEVDGGLLQHYKKKRWAGADDKPVNILKSSYKRKMKKQSLAWQDLIDINTELLQIQNIPFLGELFGTGIRAHKMKQRKRIFQLEKLLKAAIKGARAHPEDPVPLQVQRKMNLSHDLKLGEIIKLFDNVKKSVQDELAPPNVGSESLYEDSISELENWKILVSVYKDAMKMKKDLESSDLWQDQPSKEEFRSLGEKLKPLEAQFRVARRRVHVKNFNKEMSSSIQEMLKISHSLTVGQVDACMIYVRDLLKDEEMSLKSDGKQMDQSCENEYWKDLDRIYRKYKIIGLKLKLDFNIEEGEQVILAGENLTAVIRIKEQLEDLEKELIVKEKQGKENKYKRKKNKEGVIQNYNDVHKQQVRVLQRYQTVMDRIVNPEQLQQS